MRLALNDGLLESYISAMLRDKKSLVYHYRRIAFLRDAEQPEIMKTYLQGTELLNEWRKLTHMVIKY